MTSQAIDLKALRARCIAVMDRHECIAFGLSGGKDSLAVLYLLQDQAHRFTAYHMDTGDLLPEVVEAVEQAKALCPNFVHIRGDVLAWHRANGLPSDLVRDQRGAAVAPSSGLRMVPRYDCCVANLMRPIWQRMVADGNTLVIRGTKAVDLPRLPVVSGQIVDGVEFLLPLQDWSHAEVFAYLRAEGVPISRVYEHMTNAPECARCPAWLGENRAAYLRQYHPALAADYRARLHAVWREIDPALQAAAAVMARLEATPTPATVEGPTP